MVRSLDRFRFQSLDRYQLRSRCPDFQFHFLDHFHCPNWFWDCFVRRFRFEPVSLNWVSLRNLLRSGLRQDREKAKRQQQDLLTEKDWVMDLLSALGLRLDSDQELVQELGLVQELELDRELQVLESESVRGIEQRSDQKPLEFQPSRWRRCRDWD